MLSHKDGNGRGTELMDGKNETDKAERLQQTVDALSLRLETLNDAVERMEARLDVLYDECQRIGGSAQRTLLRQESISQSLTRIEGFLQNK